MRSIAILALLAAIAPPAHSEPARTLRVCADPNNLPFSSRDGTGFENRIAELLARDMGAVIQYTWWAQRRGFFRSTLKEKKCDVVLGVPAGLEMVRTTRPYYRSSYVFVSRADRHLDIRSLDDPRLRRLTIGVQVIGDDGANAPPAHALARRGIVDNVVGYTVYGDYSQDSPPADVLRAVARGDIDIAIAWGPLAGAFARRSTTRLTVRPVAESEDAGIPLVFDIAMGVRHPDEALARQIDRILVRRKRQIDAILSESGVPRVRRRAAR
jgi:mxaJ protein